MTFFGSHLLKSNVGQHGKLLLSIFVEFLCVRTCGDATSLPFVPKWY